MAKTEMKIEEFNDINTSLSEIISTLSEFDNVDIMAAKKSIKDAGKKISEYYYRYEQNTNYPKDAEKLETV